MFSFQSLLFNSSAAGDWVNCGICGEWAHFGCDRRQGLGAFKVLHLHHHLQLYKKSTGSIQCKTLYCIKDSFFVLSQLVQDYAKTDGLEYICPHCSITNFKKKQGVANGYSQGSMSSRPLWYSFLHPFWSSGQLVYPFVDWSVISVF